MTLSNHQKGFRRDKEIIEAINSFRVLTTEQIEVLFFPNIKNPRRMAQRRLLKLYNRKKIFRTRVSLDEPFHYFTTPRPPRQWEHITGINWALIWLIKNRRSWEQVHAIEYPDFKFMRPDALVSFKNKVTGGFRFVFVEFDNIPRNAFDKVKLYNELYDSEKYSSHWLAETASGFPAVLVVTNRDIRKHIESENVHDLEFIVKELDNIRRDFE